MSTKEKSSIIYRTNIGLLDITTNSFLNIDTWIATELERLGRNKQPRNCINYEALLHVVENTGTFNSSSTSVYQNCKTKTRHTPMLSRSKENRKHDLSKIIRQDMALTTVKKDFLTQRNLIHSFARLITYCRHGSSKSQLHHHHRPIELLLELEKMDDLLIKGDFNIDSIDCTRENLSRIVFGKKVPIFGFLVSAWIVISLWVQQGHSSVNSREMRKNEDWINFGVNAYLAAKKLIWNCELRLVSTSDIGI